MTGTSIALGFFDGVHIAHKKIIEATVRYAQKNSFSPVALTFDRSPLEILSPGKVRYLTDSKEKAELIKALGADMQVLTLSKELLALSPEEFVRNILVSEFGIKHAVCGFNYRFGKGGSGDTNTLTELGKKYGFTVEVCDKVMYDEADVSSSRIRKLLDEGNISLANKLLGRNYSLCGTVTEGKHLGKTLGFPTANVFFKPDRATLLCGVYETAVFIDGIKLPAITNVGINPTVGGEKMRSETFIPDFSEDIYDKEIKIEFIDFIRKETKFENLELLKKQINEDVNTIKKG